MSLELPDLSTDLIAHLDKVYPHRCPTPDMTDREIWLYAGSRLVVDTLLQELEAKREQLTPTIYT